MSGLIDYYRAAGAEVQEDGETVIIRGALQPVDIVLTVAPWIFETGSDGGDFIEFHVLPYGTGNVRLPVEQIRLARGVR